jgi:hypothetical protein
MSPTSISIWVESPSIAKLMASSKLVHPVRADASPRKVLPETHHPLFMSEDWECYEFALIILSIW